MAAKRSSGAVPSPRAPLPSSSTRADGERSPAGEDWRESARFPPGSYVRVMVDHCLRYGQIIDVREADINRVQTTIVYDVDTIDVVDDEATVTHLRDLGTSKLEDVHLNAMQVIALQARPSPPQRGKRKT